MDEAEVMLGERIWQRNPDWTWTRQDEPTDDVLYLSSLGQALDTLLVHRQFLAEAQRIAERVKGHNMAGMRGGRAIMFHKALGELLELIELGEPNG